MSDNNNVTKSMSLSKVSCKEGVHCPNCNWLHKTSLTDRPVFCVCGLQMRQVSSSSVECVIDKSAMLVTRLGE